MTPSPQEHLEDLLGAYALDAVEPAERQIIESHLAECPRCEQEVLEHQEIAAFMSSTSDVAPAELWNVIEEEIAPPADVIPLRPRRPLPNWLMGIAAAAALALVGASFVQSQQIAELTDLVGQNPRSAAVEAALAAPGSSVLTMAATDATGAGDVTFVLTDSGLAFVLDHTLPELPDGQTYQLWAVSDGEVVSAGLLGSDLEQSAFRLDPGTASLLAITAEVAGGVVVSEQPALSTVALEG